MSKSQNLDEIKQQLRKRFIEIDPRLIFRKIGDFDQAIDGIKNVGDWEVNNVFFDKNISERCCPVGVHFYWKSKITTAAPILKDKKIEDFLSKENCLPPDIKKLCSKLSSNNELICTSTKIHSSFY